VIAPGVNFPRQVGGAQKLGFVVEALAEEAAALFEGSEMAGLGRECQRATAGKVAGDALLLHQLFEKGDCREGELEHGRCAIGAEPAI
jgi:hypothetical protein